MSAHTPGPWSRNVKPASKYPTVFAGRNTHVAYVAVQGMSDEAAEANVSLIAAAPALLAACESVLAVLTERKADCRLVAIDTLQAAIAKARVAA